MGIDSQRDERQPAGSSQEVQETERLRRLQTLADRIWLLKIITEASALSFIRAMAQNDDLADDAELLRCAIHYAERADLLTQRWDSVHFEIRATR